MKDPVRVEVLESYMAQAIEEARKGAALGEVPVGAVLAVDGVIIARAHNEVEQRRLASAHAEMLVLERAASVQRIAGVENSFRLSEGVLCVTLEPCPMCAGALRLARLGTIAYGASDDRFGAFGSLFDLSLDTRLGPLPRVVAGVQSAESKILLEQFFKSLRKDPEKDPRKRPTKEKE